MQIERSHGNLLMAQLLRYTRCNANVTPFVYNMQQSRYKVLRFFKETFYENLYTNNLHLSFVLLVVSTKAKIVMQIIS